MTPQDAAKEEVKTNVIYMGDYLVQRKKQLETEANIMWAKAKQLSKYDDPRLDPFACVLMSKVDDMAENINDMERHIKFIMRGGWGAAIPSRGYVAHYASTPPPAKIMVSMPKPFT